MIKRSKGITLVSLVITIAIMLILSTITVTMSMNRFEINNLNKMFNDIKLLEDKVSNYYLKYHVLPIARDATNNKIKYTYTSLEFDRNPGDNENYYIIDLQAMEGISLNYGKEGFTNLNSSADVYIINEATHNIYYVQGIKKDNEYYHTVTKGENISDTIPPTKPEIKIVSGTKNDDRYNTNVIFEVIPGKDNWSGISETTVNITRDGAAIDVETLKQDNRLYRISENGTYVITVTTKDNSENKNASTTEMTIVVEIPENIT